MGPGPSGETAQDQPDPLLRPYLSAASEGEAEQELGALLGALAQPLAVRIARARLRGLEADAEDVGSEVLLQVVARLRQARAEGGVPIADFKAYVARAATNACHDRLRAAHPRRFRLKNRLRYVLARQPGFALWSGPGEHSLCGFAAWREVGLRASPSALDLLRDDPHAVAGRAAGAALTDLLAALFERLGGALELEELVSAVARLQDIHDPTPAALEELQDTAQPGDDALSQLQGQGALKHLWSEIQALPPRQCAALLLNLRDPDGRDAIAVLPQSGTASLREIAAALGWPAERLAALWPRLPLEDSAIAELLALTRQQVINLRKCAKERLARRLRSSPAPASPAQR